MEPDEPLSARYETAYELGKRTGHTDTVACTDCGVFVMNVAAHDRFHSTLSEWQIQVTRMLTEAAGALRSGGTARMASPAR